MSNTLDSFVRKLIANNFQILPSLVTLEASNKKIKSFCMFKSFFPTMAKEAKKFPQKISFLLLKIVKNERAVEKIIKTQFWQKRNFFRKKFWRQNVETETFFGAKNGMLARV